MRFPHGQKAAIAAARHAVLDADANQVARQANRCTY
jgi:hypothetical protein